MANSIVEDYMNNDATVNVENVEETKPKTKARSNE